MTQHAESKWVVVGIDGSQAAIGAATWAVDEAVSRNVPLRLIHVIATTQARRSPAKEIPRNVEYFESARRHAEAIVEDLGGGK